MILLKGRRQLHGYIDFRGLKIAIENQKSSCRGWKNPDDGTEGMSLMRNAYGYFVGLLANDGDELDVYVGPDHYSDKVFIIRQLKAPDFKTYDEMKIMLGFPDAETAKDAYLKQYNDPRFFGDMTEMPFDAFKAQLENKLARKAGPGRLITEAELRAYAKRAGGKTLRKSAEIEKVISRLYLWRKWAR